MNIRALHCASLTLALLLSGAARAANPPPADYEAAFAKGFPASDGEHRVADWKLYGALAANDFIAYAARIDSALGKRIEEARGKGYQTQQLDAEIKRNKRLHDAFDDQRRRVQSLVLYAADDNSSDGGTCRRTLIYVAGEFRLIFRGGREGADALAAATIAPTCNSQPEGGLQLTAGRSPRFKCWTGVDDKTCGWRLPDMPATLKQVVESDYPASIKLRWRWRGLGTGNRVRYVDSNGNRVSEEDSILVTTPLDLRLEFVDKKGAIIWMAAAAPFSPLHSSN